MDHVEVGDLEIAFRRTGTGPPLVLLHGAVCDSRVWRLAIDAFADEFTVVAWDAPGCGGSSDAPLDLRMLGYAEYLAGFIDALDLVRPHILGHSWGSTLALELCIRDSQRVRRLVLVGGYAGWAGSLSADEVERRLAFARSVTAAIEDEGSWDPASMPGLFSDAMPPELAQELTSIMADIRAPATRTMAQALAEADQQEALGGMSVPTLLVCGDADERSPLSVQQDLVRALPRATLTVLPGLGHECYLEDPAAFAAAVLPFLRSAGH